MPVPKAPGALRLTSLQGNELIPIIGPGPQSMVVSVNTLWDGAAIGTNWYVDTVNGSDLNDGLSWETAFATMGRAFYVDGAAASDPNLDANDRIYFVGIVREQLTAPLVGANGDTLTGVAIIGAAQGGVRDDDASKWTYPASGAVAGGALLEVTQQGWGVYNFLMTPEPTGGACILTPNTGTAATGEGGHLIARGMRFVGIDVTTTYGIHDPDGCGFFDIQDCQFFLLTTGIYNSATPNAIPLGWKVIGNRFISNTNHISMSSTDGIFQNNIFVTEATVNIDLIAVAGQGATNVVTGNVFHNAAADITSSDGYQGSLTDVWTQNFATDQAVFGVPT